MDPRDQGIVPPGEFTYEDYLATPADGNRYQILDGDLVVTAQPTTLHQKISWRLHRAIGVHVEDHDLGLVLAAPVCVLLSGKNVVEPDLVFVSKDRLSIVELERISGPPDLVVEILSPSTRRVDRGRKAAIYARFGVAWYCIADPVSRSIEEFQLVGGTFALRARVETGSFEPRLFPGLSIDVAKLFAP